MQYQGHRLLAVFALLLLLLVAGGQPTFAEGLDEKDGGPGLGAQAITLGTPAMQTQGYSWSNGALNPTAYPATDAIAPDGYDWSDGDAVELPDGYDWSDGD